MAPDIANYYDILCKRLGVNVVYADGYLEDADDKAEYDDLELADGEDGPLPSEQDLIDEFVVLKQEIADLTAYTSKRNTTKQEELLKKLADCSITDEEMKIAVRMLFDRILRLEKKLGL